MGIIAFLYYNKAVSEAKSICKNDLRSTLLMVEMDLRKAAMENRPFHFDTSRYKLHTGLFDTRQNKLFGNLQYSDIDFNRTMIIQPEYVQMIKKLDEPVLGVRYLVAEDIRMPLQLHQLKLLIALTIFVSMLFVAFIGYWLSRLLLKPVRKRIEELDRFIKDTTHEINTPVTALLMSVSALRKKGCAEEKLLSHISISSKQIATIYNALSHVSFESHIPKNPVRFDLKKELQKTVVFFKEIAESKKIRLLTEMESTYITMDKNDLRKLVNNLLSNAVKYSFPETTVTITLKAGKLSVKDEGIGIDETEKAEILKRYKRASDIGGGFGIGLDIVNTICKAYDITLQIDSKKGEGAEFILDFSNLMKS